MNSAFHRFVAVVGVLALAAAACSDDPEGTDTAAPTTAISVVGVAGCTDSAEVMPGRSTGVLESAGLERSYLLMVPDGYDRSAAVPLVVEFHGYTMTAGEQASWSNLGAYGQAEGFITVLPEGRGDVPRWLFELDELGVDVSLANPDIVFVSDLLDHLIEELCVDSNRLYATGFSNGGWAVSAVACTLSERFAAVAPVSGIMDFGDSCQPTVALPMLTFHGTSDGYEPFEGGVENAPRRNELPTDVDGNYSDLPLNGNPILELSVPEKVTAWAERNGCEMSPSEASITPEITLWDYDCPDSAPVALYEIDGGFHDWPGRQFATTDIDANELMWEFFQEHSR